MSDTPPDRPLRIAGPGEPMLGLLSPARRTPPSGWGVVLVAGGAQTRLGPHRQFRRLAHALAEHGHAALRIDLPGQGDSPGPALPYPATGAHLGAAIDALCANAPVQHAVLWGLCDGASAALLHAHTAPHPRLGALALLNPWLEPLGDVAQVRAQRYYRQRLREPAFWAKLLRGGVGWAALRAAAGRLAGAQPDASPADAAPAAATNEALRQAWRQLNLPLLLLTGARDVTGTAFRQQVTHNKDWRRAPALAPWTDHPVADADHTLSEPSHEAEAFAALLAWMARMPGEAGRHERLKSPAPPAAPPP